ncbi:Hypothetical protein SCF082_LOCUS3301 [Durusdinium trenchii]|uniref:TLC domain-containing protein n=1 Tax=Durusdinium trenchii TaxID=1381693 RepID=A0ABP0HVP8_9DINO
MDWQSLAFHDLVFEGEASIQDMYVATYSKAMPYMAFFLLLWAMYAAGLWWTLGSKICRVSSRTWALKLMMLTHHGVITPLALWSMWEDPVIRQLYSCIGCKEAARLMNRAAGVPPLAARALTPVTLGYFTADLLLLSQWDLTKGSKLEFYLMLVHHIASMLVWPAAIYFDWVARYVIIMLSYESTSLLLTLLWLINAAGYKKSSLYVVTGLLFTCLFIALRLLGAVPQVIAMYWVPPWSATVLEAEGGIHRLASLCCRSLVLPHVMNLFWGAKVVEGAFSTFTGTKKSS